MTDLKLDEAGEREAVALACVMLTSPALLHARKLVALRRVAEAAEISERTVANGKLNICGVCQCLFHHCAGLHPDCKGAKLRTALRDAGYSEDARKGQGSESEGKV